MAAALPLWILLTSFVAALAIFAIKEEAVRMRTTINLLAAVLKIALVGWLVYGVYRGEDFYLGYTLLPGLELAFRADAFSVLFLVLSAILWLVTTLYAVGYLEHAQNQRRFFGFFSLCVTATMGIALSANLLTFLFFYELLTLTTYPLIAHRGSAASQRGARIYLAYTLFGGALALAGTAWLYTLTGGVDFTTGGALDEGMIARHSGALIVIFVLLFFGFGVKAAIVPFHGWLPVAMIAPAPVSALLHAVAVVKAGAFGIVRLIYDVYGIVPSFEMGLLTLVGAVAAVTILYGSFKALFQDGLKKRLAYSTISQVSYILLGTALFGPMGTAGGIVHLVHQGIMKITLFFAAGNIAETLHIHRVSQMRGIGRRLPLTMAAFSVGAFGMIGFPLVAGFATKWYLGLGAIESGAYWALWVLAISTLLNAAYFLPILFTAWFQKPAKAYTPPHKRLESSGWLLWPTVTTALLSLAAGLFAGADHAPLYWAMIVTELEYGGGF
jgi:multicomponent Na+:H+ antiporter subunit D